VQSNFGNLLILVISVPKKKKFLVVMFRRPKEGSQIRGGSHSLQG